MEDMGMDPKQQQAEQKAWDEEAALIDGDNAPANAAAPEAPETPAADAPAGEAAEQPTAAAQANEWDGVPEPVRKRIEQIQIDTQARDAEREQRLKSAEGRVAAMARQLQETAAAKAAAASAAPDSKAPTAGQISEAKDPEAWEKLKSDFPEWAAGIEAFVESRMPKLPPAESEESRKQAAAEASSAARDAVREELVEAQHKGWKNVVKTKEFAAWFDQQPEETKSLAASSAPADAIALLNGFRDARKQKTPAQIEAERQARLQRSTSVRGQPGAQDIDTSAMTDEQYWEYLARQDKAA